MGIMIIDYDKEGVVKPEPIDHQHAQGEEDLLPQLGDAENVDYLTYHRFIVLSLYRLDDLTRATGGNDLRLGRFGESSRFDGQRLGQLPITKNLDHQLARTADQPLLAELGRVDHFALVEVIVQVAHVDDDVALGEPGVVETDLGQSSEQRHLAAFPQCVLRRVACPRAGALVPATGRLAVAGTRAAPHALAPLAASRRLASLGQIHCLVLLVRTGLVRLSTFGRLPFRVS